MGRVFNAAYVVLVSVELPAWHHDDVDRITNVPNCFVYAHTLVLRHACRMFQNQQVDIAIAVHLLGYRGTKNNDALRFGDLPDSLD